MSKKERTKVLWVGDAVATTGFARVGHSILTNLPNRKYDIHHLGINYSGDPHEFPYKIYPAILGGDLYGIKRLESLVKETIKPDLIVLLNDPWVIQQYLKELSRFKNTVPVVTYSPIDAEEQTAEWFSLYDEQVKEVCVYTEFGKRVILESAGEYLNGYDINVIPHGIDTGVFFPYKGTDVASGTDNAKKALYPWKDRPEFLNSFIVLNANRNQPRKRIDLTIRAFSEFAKDKPDNVKLYLHMGTKDMGVDILNLAARYGIDEKLIISANTPNIPGVEDQRLNLIYNACDIGINTSVGEGWGLTSWEHAAAGKPQIVADNSVLREIWQDDAIYIDCPEYMIHERVNTLARVPSHNSIVKALEFAYNDWLNGGLELNAMATRSYERITSSKYNWKTISKQFDKVFMRAVNGN